LEDGSRKTEVVFRFTDISINFQTAKLTKNI